MIMIIIIIIGQISVKMLLEEKKKTKHRFLIYDFMKQNGTKYNRNRRKKNMEKKGNIIACKILWKAKECAKKKRMEKNIYAATHV